ncbi:unnamed protein product [Closterium sp. Yama58-4]|nr:unnamed protein product [Closterium sp. Yama58-4]
MPDEFLASNPPPLWITLYHIVTRLPDSLRAVRDHFLARSPTELTIALLEKELLAAEASIVAVGTSRGDPRTPFFEGCSPSPLLPSVASAAAVDLLGAEKVGAASAPSGRRRGKGGKGGGGGGGGGSGGGGGGGGTGEASGGSGGGDSSGGSGGRGGGGSGGGGGRGGGRGGGGRGGGGGGGGGGRGGAGGGQSQQPAPSLQAAREWYAQRGFTCTYFPDATDLPHWADLEKKGVDIWALDFDAILTAMYAMFTSGEGAQYLRVPPDPGILPSPAAALGASESAAPGPGEAAALGASESVPPGTESTAALHTFTLDSGASRCFFRDRTVLEPLARPVAVSLADPSGGPVVATSSTVLPCLAVPSGTLSGLYLPSFSTNLVAGSALQDGGVHQFTLAYERVTHCTCARTGRHLATFTRQPGSDLYTLTTESPQVAASASASASGQLSAPCSCRSLAHETVLWHHRLGHPSVQRLRAMHKRDLVAGLPRVLPPLPPSPAPPCLPCVEGRQRAAPHSSSFPPTTAPLQTLHMDVWGPARVRGQGQERYFLIVVDDFSRYTTVFPLRTKGDVPDVLIPWIRRSRLQLRERFRSDFPVLRLHSDRGGEFSSGLLEAFCQQEGIEQSFTLPASPQQNGVAERRIGLVMEVARTSLVHAAAPHFLWPFAVRYAAHQLNLWPRVSLPETSPTLRWTGEAGDASRFRVWGSRAFVRDTSADKLSRRAVPCVFLGFVPDAPGWQFYHATSRRVLASQDVTFDESVPYYRLFPYRTAPLPPPPLFLAPGAEVPDPLPPQGAAPSGVSQVDPVEPVEVAVDSRPAGGAEPDREESEGTEPGGAEPGGAEELNVQLNVREFPDWGNGMEDPPRRNQHASEDGTSACECDASPRENEPWRVQAAGNQAGRRSPCVLSPARSPKARRAQQAQRHAGLRVRDNEGAAAAAARADIDAAGGAELIGSRGDCGCDSGTARQADGQAPHPDAARRGACACRFCSWRFDSDDESDCERPCTAQDSPRFRPHPVQSAWQGAAETGVRGAALGGAGLRGTAVGGKTGGGGRAEGGGAVFRPPPGFRLGEPAACHVVAAPSHDGLTARLLLATSRSHAAFCCWDLLSSRLVSCFPPPTPTVSPSPSPAHSPASSPPNGRAPFDIRTAAMGDGGAATPATGIHTCREALATSPPPHTPLLPLSPVLPASPAPTACTAADAPKPAATQGTQGTQGGAVGAPQARLSPTLSPPFPDAPRHASALAALPCTAEARHGCSRQASEHGALPVAGRAALAGSAVERSSTGCAGAGEHAQRCAAEERSLELHSRASHHCCPLQPAPMHHRLAPPHTAAAPGGKVPLTPPASETPSLTPPTPQPASLPAPSPHPSPLPSPPNPPAHPPPPAPPSWKHLLPPEWHAAPCGASLAMVQAGGSDVRIWDVRDGGVAVGMQTEGAVQRMACCAPLLWLDEERLVVVEEGGSVGLWHVAGGEAVLFHHVQLMDPWGEAERVCAVAVMPGRRCNKRLFPSLSVLLLATRCAVSLQFLPDIRFFSFSHCMLFLCCSPMGVCAMATPTARQEGEGVTCAVASESAVYLCDWSTPAVILHRIPSSHARPPGQTLFSPRLLHVHGCSMFVDGACACMLRMQ